MLDQLSDREDADAANAMIWTFVQTPNEAFDNNSTELLKIAEDLVANTTQPSDDPYALPLHRCLNTLGAAHYRAGNYQKAIEYLLASEESFERHQHSRGLGRIAAYQYGKIWNWMFLAMAHHQLEQHNEADKYVWKVKHVYSGHPVRLADALGTPSPNWKQFLSLRNLYSEMTSTVNTPDADTSK